jgi:hypothetical protein
MTGSLLGLKKEYIMAEKNDVNSDLHYLKLLSIFHYVFGGLKFLFGFFPIIYVVLGMVMLLAPEKHGGNDGPPRLLLDLWCFSVLALPW